MTLTPTIVYYRTAAGQKQQYVDPAGGPFVLPDGATALTQQQYLTPDPGSGPKDWPQVRQALFVDSAYVAFAEAAGSAGVAGVQAVQRLEGAALAGSTEWALIASLWNAVLAQVGVSDRPTAADYDRFQGYIMAGNLPLTIDNQTGQMSVSTG